MSFILKTIKLLRLGSAVDQIFKINTSRCLLVCFCESLRYFEQFPSDLHFSHISYELKFLSLF